MNTIYGGYVRKIRLGGIPGALEGTAVSCKQSWNTLLFLLCFSPVATELNHEGVCDVERMWKACEKQTHTQVFLTLRAPERQK